MLRKCNNWVIHSIYGSRMLIYFENGINCHQIFETIEKSDVNETEKKLYSKKPLVK